MQFEGYTCDWLDIHLYLYDTDCPYDAAHGF